MSVGKKDYDVFDSVYKMNSNFLLNKDNIRISILATMNQLEDLIISKNNRN